MALRLYTGMLITLIFLGCSLESEIDRTVQRKSPSESSDNNKNARTDDLSNGERARSTAGRAPARDDEDDEDNKKSDRGSRDSADDNENNGDNDREVINTGSASEALNLIEASAFKKIIADLTTDEMAGRGSCSEGYELAGQYMANKFKGYGLEKIPGKNSYLQVFTVPRQNCKTENIIGILPGSDPVLKNEVIVVGAHLDHLGVKNGKIHPGADDNASGTAVVMKVAKALSSLKGKNKRTVVFIGFGAEELGLHGSKYYVSNPIFPISKTVYMINLDMVGYGKDSVNVVNGSKGKFGNVTSETASKVSALRVVTKSSTFSSGGSDHAPFAAKSVPFAYLNTGMHPNYHRPSDTKEKINYKNLTNIAKYVFELTLSLSTK